MNSSNSHYDFGVIVDKENKSNDIRKKECFQLDYIVVAYYSGKDGLKTKKIKVIEECPYYHLGDFVAFNKDSNETKDNLYIVPVYELHEEKNKNYAEFLIKLMIRKYCSIEDKNNMGSKRLKLSIEGLARLLESYQGNKKYYILNFNDKIRKSYHKAK